MTKEEFAQRFKLLCPIAEYKVLEQFGTLEVESQNIRKAVENIPELYGQENEEDPIVYLHYFGGSHDFYITEYSETAPDGCKNLAFGLVSIGNGYESELTYINIDELKQIELVNLDLHFEPCKLSVLDK